MPQDPLHLHGTLRFNSDPLSRSTDPEIISALEKVQLWSLLSVRGGLDAELTLDSLSKGQQQLLALARALLGRSKVVILDEATSSVDNETDGVMREVMKREFEGCTVVVVAHRLSSLEDCDVVVVMDGGRIVEVGEPGKLLVMGRESAFGRLWGR